jgi:flagellar protein FlgJ
MAISVSTDLVMDVLNAAKPSSIAAADAALKAVKTSPVEIAAAGEKFANELMSSISKAVSKAEPEAMKMDASDLRRSFETPNQADAHIKFESMVLHQFVQHMLPSEGSVIFGEGMSGEVWKGMMAQQIGDAIAKGGGIGIAEKMLAQKQNVQNIPNQASGIINNQERDILDSLASRPKL